MAHTYRNSAVAACLRRLIAIGLTAFGFVSTAAAEPFDPVVELFRLGAGDRLLIDRGGPVDLAGDVNGDGLDDLLVGSGVGGIRVVFGPTQGNNGVLNGQQLDGVSGFTIVHDDTNISHVAGIGDVNNDGLDDVMVGSLNGAHVIFGSRERFPRILDVRTLNGNNGFSISVSASSVSAAGDVNADGVADLIIGNANATINSLEAVGAAYVLYGRTSAFPARIAESAFDGNQGFVVIGEQQQDRFGHSVAMAGDFNHDGVSDLIVGAPNKTQASLPEAGAAYLIYGQPAGHPRTVSVADLNAETGLIVRGSTNQTAVGAAVSGIGDFNHDGVDDVAIGAPGKGPFGTPTNYPGEVYVLLGGKYNGVTAINRGSITGANGVVVRGIRGGVVPIQEGEAIWGDLAGTSLDGLQDFNGDGVDDLLIGASHTIINPRRKGVGQAYIVFGTPAGLPQQLNLADLNGANGFRINGIGTVDYFAVYSATAGDFNDDGNQDFIAGASGEGASYVIYGRNYGLPRINPPSRPSLNSYPAVLPEAARLVGPNATPLAFNELADPTGPTPYPVGTPTDVNNPNTPGYIPPNLFDPVEVLRPDATVPVEPEPNPNPNPNPDPTVTPNPNDGESPLPVPTPEPENPNVTPPADPVNPDPNPDGDPGANPGTDPVTNPVSDPVSDPVAGPVDDPSAPRELANGPVKVGSLAWIELFIALLVLVWHGRSQTLRLLVKGSDLYSR